MARPFAEQGVRTQIGHWRARAVTALEAWPIEVESVRLLLHGYNTSFAVRATDGSRYALRLSVNDHKTIPHLRAEMAWLAALAEDTDLSLPSPQPTRAGELFTIVPDAQLGRELPAALFAWLPGPNLGRWPRPDQVRALGRAMATLHGHSADWRLPQGCELPSIDTVLMNVPNRMHRDHPLLTDERRHVLGDAFDQVQGHYDAIFADAQQQVLHADLHGGNLKWHRGRLSVFDFDDAGIGVPLQDLAISAFYLRDRLDLEAELLAGYAEVLPLPAFSAEQYEAVLASRNLVLVNDTIGSSHARVRDGAELYVANTVVKLRHYLETGRFAHDVDGVVPAR